MKDINVKVIIKASGTGPSMLDSKRAHVGIVGYYNSLVRPAR